MTNRIITALTVASLFLLPLWADEPVQASGRAFFGVAGQTFGDSDLLLHFGGGGEGKIAGGLGATLDLGYLFSSDGFAGGIGILSPGLIYHFNRESRTTPFLNGGYSLLFRGHAANLAFAGGGVDHWFSRRTGFRVEVRGHFRDEGIIEGRFSFLLR